MQPARRRLLALITLTLAVTSIPAVAQVVVATVPAGGNPSSVAVNAVTNKTYAINFCGDDPQCASNGTLTVIDGATLATQTVTLGVQPFALAVNAVTNKIYVVNYCGDDPNCANSGTVTVIDGATLATQSVSTGLYPQGIAVNSVTNKIYATNSCGNDPFCASNGTVTVIDGITLTTKSVDVGYYPYGVAVNPVTNKIWVANTCGADTNCANTSLGTATVIDGISLGTQSVNVDLAPYDLDVNSATNKIYVDNYCGTDPDCASAGTVMVIDGSSLATQRVAVGVGPYDVKVNAVTNKTYVPNVCGSDPTCSSLGTATVIDGMTLSTVTVPVGAFPVQAAINPTTNSIYVVNNCGNDPKCGFAGTVTAIDGATNTTKPVAVGDFPTAVALNSATNTIYTPNAADSTVSVIGGSTVLQLVNVTPCRLVDTRTINGGGGPIQGDTFQTFNLPQLSQAKGCGDLSSAATYSLNVTLIPSHHPVGYLTIWPASQLQPNVSTMNSDGRVKANAAIVPAGVSGEVSVFVTDTADVVLDIDGYFGPATQSKLPGPSTLAFYPLTPCRVADTRDSNFPQGLGPPMLSAGVPRDFPVLLATSCNIPSNVAAYSLNFTAVPHGLPLGYLTVWPAGLSQPFVSTLNAPTGAVTANAAIVPAGTGGAISTFAYNNTDLIIDINGYFASPEMGGLSLYPLAPCRVLDTRLAVGGNGPFVGTLSPPVDVLGSPCGASAQSQAYVFNATVVPPGGAPMGYLTLWPDGGNQPNVSTLNAYDGKITSNMAIVPAGTVGKINAYAFNLTDLILDISSYFAP